MHAFRKKDGLYIKLSDYVYDEQGNEIPWEDVTLVSEVNNDVLEHVRNAAAVSAQKALIETTIDKERFNTIVGRMVDRHMSLAGIIAMDAVTHADALVNELAKGKKFYTAGGIKTTDFTD